MIAGFVESGDSLVVLGRLRGPHGLKGWIRIQSFTRPVDEIFIFPRWLIGEGASRREAKVEDFRPQGKGWVVKLADCEDRNQAELLRNLEIAVPREQLNELEDGEYYWRDLMGLTVVTLSGAVLGEVDHLVETGANDVLVVKGDRERLIPFIQGDVIRCVDLEAGAVEVDWDPDF